MAAALGGGADDDFDQFDKPGAERSWRRRAGDDDWDRASEELSWLEELRKPEQGPHVLLEHRWEGALLVLGLLWELDRK